MKARWFALALVTVLAALSYAPVASTKATSQNATTVTVTMKEFKFTLSKRTVASWCGDLQARQQGRAPARLQDRGQEVQDDRARARPACSSVTLTRGSKPYICTVPGHAAGGMKGTLKVT